MTSDAAITPALGVRGLDEMFEATTGASEQPQPWTGFEHMLDT
ncbi:hypothetical protein [Kitasatospora sp. NPDC050543]